MTTHDLEADRKPVRAVLIGAGKFGSMYLSQARRTPGLRPMASPARTPRNRSCDHLAAIVDQPGQAIENRLTTGRLTHIGPPEISAARSPRGSRALRERRSVAVVAPLVAMIQTLTGRRARLECVMFSPDGKRLATSESGADA